MKDILVHVVFAFTFLLAVLTLAVDSVSSVHLVLAYLFLAFIAFNQYDADAHDGISPLFSLQVGLTFALGTVLIVLVVGGLGFRTLELLAVFFLLLAFVLVRDDIVDVLPTAAPYFAAFAVLFGIFLHHAREFGAGSGLGLFPVLAGLILAFNLFVLPRYVSTDAVYWTVGTIAAGVTALSLPAIVLGDFSLWAFEIRTWGGDISPPFVDREIPVLRAIFANPNTFGLLVFPGLVASIVATHRTITRGDHPIFAVVSLCYLPLIALGLYLSNSRASMLAAAIAVAIYALVVLTDERAIPFALLTVALAVPAFLVGIYLSIIPIDPAHRFTLWRAGIEAVYHDSGLLGQGIVGTGSAIEPYLESGGSVHNSYLSVFIRAGLLGGLAYCLLLLGPLVHGLISYHRVDVGMLSLATGFAIHQLFEGYTLYQFGPGSVLGALAIGYVIASLAGEEPTAHASNETASPKTDPSSTEAFGYATDVTYRAESRDERS